MQPLWLYWKRKLARWTGQTAAAIIKAARRTNTALRQQETPDNHPALGRAPV